MYLFSPSLTKTTNHQVVFYLLKQKVEYPDFELSLADSSLDFFIVLPVTFFQFACGSLLSCFLSCRTPVVLQDTLVLDLLYSEAGQSLLNILGTGVDTVDKLVSLGRYDAGLKKCLNSSLPYGQLLETQILLTWGASHLPSFQTH